MSTCFNVKAQHLEMIYFRNIAEVIYLFMPKEVAGNIILEKFQGWSKNINSLLMEKKR